ncbi:MAG: choice-of-anchor L domain-containing protein [Labilibaculum sp.]|nr:choice-of-anchor L domain-containing protein [Labilibaculum sp.]
MQDFTLNSSFSLFSLRILCVILPFIGFSIEVNAQTDYNMPTSGTTTVNVVSGDRFFDSGGFNPSGAYDAAYDYGGNQRANIIFQAPVGSVIRVTFVEFEVEDRGNSIYDRLLCYDGSGTGGTRLGRYYGTSGGSNTDRPSVVISSDNLLTFRFVSDGSVEEEGWEAIIEVLSPPCSVGSDLIWTENFETAAVKGTSTSTEIKRQKYPGNQSGGWGMVGSNIGNLRTWQSNSIDISAFKDIRVSMDVGSWRNKMENTDYINLSYSVDGAGFVEFSSNGSFINVIGAQEACSNIPNGSNLVIRVSMYNNATNEFYYVDNISVTGELIAVGNPPNAICKDYTVSLDASGNARIAPMDINNGSNDLETAESDLILSLDKRDFTCADLGDNTITLSVNDLDGNVSTCTSTLTVQDLVAPSLLNLNAEYYTGINFNSLLYSEAVDEIDSDWGNGSPNAGLVGNDNFSVRYTGSFVVPETGNYIFYTNSDDGVRLAIDGSYVIDNWTDHGPTVDSGTRNLSKGEHTIALEYYERGGGAVIELEWASADAGVARQVFSKSSILNHTIIETTLTLNASGNATLLPADVDPGFIDNCGIVTSTLSKSNFTASDIGSNVVVLTVSDASGNSATCSLNVIVNPFVPEVSLSVNVNSINENGGNAFLTATLNGVSSIDVFVNLAMSGTASSSDYSISNLQIVVPHGSLTASVTLSSVDDVDVEGDEILNVSVGSLVNGTENGTQMVMLTIVDDDVPSTDPIRVDRQSPENTYSPNDLVQNILVTGCLTASGVQYGGDQTLGVGYFNAGDSDFPLSSGLIMSTGRVRKAEGPNSGNVSDNIGSAAVDADVNRLNGSARDIQILEFDFVPAGNKLEFRYLFASEEYPEYACGSYNDVFGFILSGPGISGPFLNGGENIALLPSSTNFVTINNVNDQGCGNSSYYVDGAGGFATQFDGRTSVLTASADVVACQTYHIRLIIADVWDDAYNSAVFLEAESFKSNEVSIQNGIGVEDDVDVMYEGCNGSYIKFIRAEDFDEELTFDLNISGSAENGVDYVYVDQVGNQIGNGELPNSVTIPAGIDEVVYYYKALLDTGIEGDEELRLSFLKSCPCSAPDYYEKVVTIIDVPEIEASPTSLVSCLGATPVATITIDLKAGLDPADYQYSMDGGAFQDDNVFSLNNPIVGETHTVMVQDHFACKSASFDVVMPTVTPIAAEAGSNKSMCEGETVQLEGSGGIYYEWSCSPVSGLSYLSNVNVSNPTVSTDIPFGSYTFTLTVKEFNSATASCVDTDFMILTVKENSHFTIASDKTEYCSSEVISLSSTILNSSGSDSYSWTPVVGLVSPTSANTTANYSVAVISAKDFSLTITKLNGCSNSEYISGVLINPYPAVSLNTSSNLCSDGSNGVLNVDVSGGTPFSSNPFYNYSWSHDGGLDSPNATGLNPGSYSVTVTDSKSCTETGSYTIGSEPIPLGIYHE